MPHDDHTFNACGAMTSGRQDGFMMKLALQPVASQWPISCRLVAEGFTAKEIMKSDSDRSATNRKVAMPVST